MNDVEAARPKLLRRIPVRRRNETVFVPVESIAAVVAEIDQLHISTATGDEYTICFRLKDLEARLDPDQFVRISRSTLVNLSMVAKLVHSRGGMYRFILTNGQELDSSRLQSRVMRERLLRL